MRREVFLREELVAELQALAYAGQALTASAGSPEGEAIRQGWQMALNALAIKLQIVEKPGGACIVQPARARIAPRQTAHIIQRG